MNQGSPDAAPADAAPNAKSGILRDWVLPIVVGLAIGAGLVSGWRALRSPTEKLLARWVWEDYENNRELEDLVRGLGKEAREDLLSAFRGIDVLDDLDGLHEKKVWVANLLAAEPFFDTRSLLDIARDPSAPKWDRRAAAAALVTLLRADVDVEAVVEPLLAWLEDLSLLDHARPMTCLRTMRVDKVFPPDRDERWRRALVRIADTASRPSPADPDEAGLVEEDRLRAISELGTAATDPEVREFLWRVASDEKSETRPRVEALRAFAENRQNDTFKEHDRWKAVAKSADAAVRQTVADNLHRTQDAEYDGLLADLHADAAEFVRSGSIDSQLVRKRPTMLPVMGALLEDHSEAVRTAALAACGAFKQHVDGIAVRQGMLLRILESSDSASDVEGAILALNRMTGECFGFPPGDIDLRIDDVTDAAVAVFLADKEAREKALAKWREKLGSSAVWSDADRRAILEKMLQHADPANVERAKRELGR